MQSTMNAPAEDVEMASGDPDKTQEVVIEPPRAAAPTNEVSSALAALESLGPVSSTVTQVIEGDIAAAKKRIENGEDVKKVIQDLQKTLVKSKKDVEKGLKDWYGHLGKIGKQVDKAFPAQISTISAAYDEPTPLFSSEAETAAVDRTILQSMGSRGLWGPVSALEEEAGLVYDPVKRKLNVELHAILEEIEAGDVSSALEWTTKHRSFLSAPPHPSPLPFYLHRSRFIHLLSQPPTPDSIYPPALAYAHAHLLPHFAKHNEVILKLLTAYLYKSRSGSSSPYGELEDPNLHAPILVPLFTAEFCRLHGWAREEPLDVAVDLGGRGGALSMIEKGRRVMGDRLGDVRQWDELPMEIPLPLARRYHSVFVCPVSKDQGTETNPPKMLACGHVIAEESLKRLLKGNRRAAKCPYCPVETTVVAAQRLYF